MADMPAAYRKTRHPCVLWRGAALYVTYRSEARDQRGERRDQARLEFAHSATDGGFGLMQSASRCGKAAFLHDLQKGKGFIQIK